MICPNCQRVLRLKWGNGLVWCYDCRQALEIKKAREQSPVSTSTDDSGRKVDFLKIALATVLPLAIGQIPKGSHSELWTLGLIGVALFFSFRLLKSRETLTTGSQKRWVPVALLIALGAVSIIAVGWKQWSPRIIPGLYPERAAEIPVRRYIESLNKLLAVPSGAKVGPDQIQAFEDGLGYLQPDLALKKLREACNAATIEFPPEQSPGEHQFFADAWAKVPADKRAAVVEGFLSFYKPRATVMVLGATTLGFNNLSAETKVSAVIQYTGKFLISRGDKEGVTPLPLVAQVEKMTLDDFTDALYAPNSQKWEIVHQFLKTAFVKSNGLGGWLPMSDDDADTAIGAFSRKSIVELRNATRWEDIACKGLNGLWYKINPDLLTDGFETCMVTYPVARHSDRNESFADKWFRNKWKIGDASDDRFVVRSSIN